MLQSAQLQRWLITALCCLAVCSIAGTTTAGEPKPLRHAQLKVMLMIDEVEGQGTQTAEIVLSRAFTSRGYSVLNPDVVAKTRRRNDYLRKRYETEAAKRLGAFLAADLVIIGKSRAWVLEEDSGLVGKFKRSEAEVSARVVVVKSGQEIVADYARGRKAFDATGQVALRTAAEALADKLLQEMENWQSRRTIEYEVVTPPASQTAVQEQLRDVPGVQQITPLGPGEYKVIVDKDQNIRFEKTLLTPPSTSGSGGIGIVAREGEQLILDSDSPPPSKANYRKSWAVIIGINNYQKGWGTLRYAEKDAHDMEKLLEKLGFTLVVPPILNEKATKQSIERVLVTELKEKTDKEDRVFIFFAGHGQTESLPYDGKEGYIIPFDAPMGDYYTSSISMSDLRLLTKHIPAKHIFYAMDSCFSGLLLRRHGEAEDPTVAQTVQALTAGGEGELVREVGGNGIFTKALLSGLEGAAYRAENPFLTARELFRFISQRVQEETKKQQNPAFGHLRGKSEFVFDRKP